MANNADAAMALLQLFTGTPNRTVKSSGGTQTQQTQLSQEAVNALLKGLMEGTSGRPGLAAVSAGQKAPGLYNTTSRSLLTNDLMARAAAEVAKASAPTVTKTSPSTQTQSGQQGILGQAGSDLMKAYSAYKFLSNSSMGKKILGPMEEKIGKTFEDIFSPLIGGAAAVPAVAGGSAVDMANVMSTPGAYGPMSVSSDFAASSSLGQAISSLLGEGSAGVDVFGEMLDVNMANYTPSDFWDTDMSFSYTPDLSNATAADASAFFGNAASNDALEASLSDFAAEWF